MKSGWPSLWQRIFLLVLAVLNLWAVFERRWALALMNGVMAVVLLVLLILTWGKKPK